MAVFDAGVPGVALNAVYDAILYTLNDACVIGKAAARPIIKDQVAGTWLIVHALPLVARLKPFHAVLIEEV